MNDVFLSAVLIMAITTYGCRLLGILVGDYFAGNPSLRRLLDILPTCAIAAVIGPTLGHATPVQVVTLATAGGVFLMTTRFFVALWAGIAVLLIAPHII